MNALLDHPWHHRGAVVARLSVNAATLIWSLVVLFSPSGLAPTAYGQYILTIAPAWAWACFFLSISSFMLYRLVRKCRPHAIGIIGYVILFAAWAFVDIVLLLVARPLQPTAIATVSVITGLAAYGFIANPRARNVVT